VGPLHDRNDPLLAPLIDAGDEKARAAAAESLIARATPLIDGVLARYRGPDVPPEEIEDLRGTVLVRLVRRLNDVPRSEGAAIASFGDFVATLAFNAANDFLRQLFPARTRLKNRIRYVLTRSERLATWRGHVSIVAGLAQWRGSHAIGSAPHGLALHRGELEPALIALFEHVGAPLVLDDVVSSLAESWGIVEERTVPADQAHDRGRGDDSFEQRDYLSAVWTEIRDLRPAYRTALLLNLRDGDSVSAIELFVLLGIATIDDIAGALEMPAADLAAIWNSLPQDDHTIAARLGVSRQQVINFRRAARDRLARKMAARENRRR
jgi:hypothetical protein